MTPQSRRAAAASCHRQQRSSHAPRLLPQAVIITGTGKYYSAGADIAAMMRPALLSTIRQHITQYNQSIFDAYLKFPKPLFAAVNGPAVGMGVTTATLTDAIVASSTATFHTPFRQLGLAPEGCSSFNFPRLIGQENATVNALHGPCVRSSLPLCYSVCSG